MDIGVHVLDLARFFLGEAGEVFCRTNSIKPGIAGEDMATVMLQHESGITSVNDFTYESRQTPEVFPQTLLHIEGTAGSIHMAPDYHMVVTTSAGTRIDRPVPENSGLGQSALVAGAGERGQHPAALARCARCRTRGRYLGARQYSRPSRWSRPATKSARTGLPAKPATVA